MKGREMGRRTEVQGPLTTVSKQDGEVERCYDYSEGQTIMSVLLLGQ